MPRSELNAEQQMKRIGQRIAVRRKATGLSQAELAKRMQVNQQQVSEWENGKKELRALTVGKLANALGCSPGDLLDGIQ